MLRFSLFGAAGFVAPRHMRAIKETGNTLVSVFDPTENLGILDQYFPSAECFSDFSAYKGFHEMENPLDYVTICSPNNRHFEQISWALQRQAHVICEKPMVINPDELPMLLDLEKQTGKKINTILQLRLHDKVIALKKEIQSNTSVKKYEVRMDYITARGNWYFNSWKGREAESGGIVTNIGIHLFDLLIWLFGNVEDVSIGEYGRERVSGHLELKKASIKWALSIDEKDLPMETIESGKRFFRQLTIDGVSFRLDDGMEGLHTACYREIFAGNGPGIADATPSIELCSRIQRMAD